MTTQQLDEWIAELEQDFYVGRHAAAYAGLSRLLDVARRNGTPYQPRHATEVAS